MTNRFASALAAVSLFATTTAVLRAADDAGPLLQKTAAALGVTKLTSIQYSGSGKAASLGQSYTPQDAWPTLNVKSYTRTIEFSSQCSREEMVRTLEAPAAKGGGAPFQGEQKQVNYVCGPYAWNQPGENPVAVFGGSGERQLQILSTPQGFVKQALVSNATMKKVKGGNEVTISAIGRYKLTATIDGQGMVSKIETTIGNPVLGDMAYESAFTDYKDFGGVKFPSHIVQKQGGFMTLDITVDKVQANPADAAMAAPDSVKQAVTPPVVATSQKLADGVWFIGGGSHNSVVIEYKDFIAVVEAPNSEERSLAVIAEAKKLVPNKPIRYLINTHHHWDHSSGIRTYVAEGATVITSEANKAYYEDAWKRPRTIEPDNLSRNPKKAAFVTVKDKYVLTDGDRSLELNLTQGDNHNAYILFGYMPKEKILIEADDFTPSAPNGPAMVPLAKTFADNLYENVQRMKLDVVTIVPLHGRVVPYVEFPKALGKS